MSERGNSRDRQQEPNEQQRAARRVANLCITCARPSKTQRCRECTRRIEANTDRYAGQAQRGRPPTIAIDIRDVRFAAEELGKTYAGLTEIQRMGPMQPRKRDDLMTQPLHHAHLAWKFLGEVLDRSGLFAKAKAKAKLKSKPAPKPTGKTPVDVRQLAFGFAGTGR